MCARRRRRACSAQRRVTAPCNSVSPGVTGGVSFRSQGNGVKLTRVNSTHGRCVAALLALWFASAQAAPVLPYQGRLDRSGAPQSGTFQLRFSLYAAPAGGAALWTDTFSGVVVVGGQFSVKLGAGAPLTDALLALPQLYLEVEVQGAGESTFTKLLGRQQLLHVPYAAMSSGDFRVNGRLTVGAAVDGGALITDGGFAEVITGPLQIVTSSGQLSVDGRTLQSSGALSLQPNQAATQVGGPLSVGGALSVTGDASANRFRPNYDSGWFFVTNNSGDITRNHGLGALPSFYVLQQCGGLPTNPATGAFDAFLGKCPTRVLMGQGGYHDSGTQVNPVTVSVDDTSFVVGMLSSWWAWNYWTNAKGWNCPVADCFSAYYRLLGWR